MNLVRKQSENHLHRTYQFTIHSHMLFHLIVTSSRMRVNIMPLCSWRRVMLRERKDSSMQRHSSLWCFCICLCVCSVCGTVISCPGTTVLKWRDTIFWSWGCCTFILSFIHRVTTIIGVPISTKKSSKLKTIGWLKSTTSEMLRKTLKQNGGCC